MEPRILIFPDLVFVHCVTFRDKTVVCVSFVKLSLFLVAVKQCLVMSLWTVGCMDVGNRY